MGRQIESGGAEPLELDPGRWTFCPDCLTVYDDYGKAVNEIMEWRILH